MDVFDLQARIGLNTSDYEKGVLNVRDSFGALKNAVEDAVSGIYSASSAAVSVLSALFGCSADSFGALGQLKNSFTETFARDMPDAVKNTEQALASAGDTAGRYLKALTYPAGSMLSGLGSNAEKAADTVSSMLSGLGSDAGKAADTVGSMLRGLGNDAGKAADTAGSALKSISDGAVGSGDKISRAFNGIFTLSNVREALSGYRELYDNISAVNSQLGREAETVKNNSGAYAGHSEALRALGGEYENAAGYCRDSENAFSALNLTFRRYEGAGSAIISGDAEKISRANENMLDSFRNTGNETARSFETQKNNFSGGYASILEAVGKGNADISAEELAAKRELHRQAAAELEKYKRLHGSKAGESGRAFADGLSRSKGQAERNAAALAGAGVSGLRSKVGDFSAAGADSGAAYGNSFISTARSVIDRLLNSEIDANNDGKTNIADVVKITSDSLNSRKTASGGVFDSPTVRLIGEDGPEAVVPLEKNTGWIDRVAGKVAEAIGGGNKNNGDFTVIMENVNIRNTDDIDSLNYELEMSRRRTIAAMGG